MSRIFDTITPLQVGRGLKMLRTLFGFAVGATGTAKKWRHPWTVDAAWAARSGKWVATVKAGYVNGVAPVFRTDTREQKQLGRDFGKNPLTGQPFFSSPVFTKAQQAAEEVQQLDIPIYLGPAIPLLAFRALGGDGFEGSEVLPYFQERGVEVFNPERRADPRTVRRLRAADVILHQPRLALTSTISSEQGVLSGVSFTRQILAVRAPEASDVLRVYAGQFAAPPDVVDPLAEQYEEPAWDERKIATVYLLSPRGAAPGSAPDGTWTAFMAHELFWNLNWAPAPVLVAPDLHPDGPFIIPLAGGVAQPLVNTILAGGNDAIQQSFNLIQAHSQAGTFWTPTGGGHDAEIPPVAAAAGKTTGLNKAEQIAQKSAAAAQLRQAQRIAQQQIDPAFPYTAVGFDPARPSSFL